MEENKNIANVIAEEAETALIKTIQQIAYYAESQPQFVESLSKGINALLDVNFRFGCSGK